MPHLNLQNKPILFVFIFPKNGLIPRKKIIFTIPCACSSIEASIDARASTQNPSPSINDSIRWNEGLGGRSRWSVCQSKVEVSKKWDIGIGKRHTPSFKHQDIEFLGEGWSQWAPSCASSHNYVVIDIVVATWWRRWGRWESACTLDEWVPKFIEIPLPCIK